MANRTASILLKSSGVVGKIPSISDLALGELAINFADAKLYSRYTAGSGATEVRQIGWDRLSLTGGTVTGNITANSFFGNGSGITGLSALNITGFTSGSVVFGSGTGLTQDNANLFWDNTNKTLSIGPIHTQISNYNNLLNLSSSSGRALLSINNTSAYGTSSIVLFNSSGHSASFEVLGPSYAGIGEAADFSTVGLDLAFNTDGGSSTGGNHVIKFVPGGYATTNERLRIAPSGVMIGYLNRNPTARLEIQASDGTLGTAPIKINAGSLLSTISDGSIEYDGTHFYSSIGTNRYQLDQQTLDQVLTAGNTSTKTISVGGATISSISNATGDFITRNSITGLLSIRTATQALSDMGGFSSSSIQSFATEGSTLDANTVNPLGGFTSYYSGYPANAASPAISYGGLITFVSYSTNNNNLQLQYGNGHSDEAYSTLWFRNKNAAGWTSWKKVWSSYDFTQTDINNWKTSYSASSAFTSGSVIFSSGSGLTQNNANLFWDNTNNRLGIGTNTPSSGTPYGNTKVHIYDTSGSGSSLVIENSGSTSLLGSELTLKTSFSYRGKGITMYSTDSNAAWGIGVPYGKPNTFQIGYVSDYTSLAYKQTETLKGQNEGIFQLTTTGNLTITGAMTVQSLSATGTVTGSNLLYTTGNQTINGIDTFTNIPNIGISNTNSIENGRYSPFYSAIAAGTPLYFDEEFASGNNAISIYNNSGGTGLTFTRVSDTQSPNRSGYKLTFTYVSGGPTSPGLGGFVPTAFIVSANRTYVHRFRAKLPIGYSFASASNALGTGNDDYFITSINGTGEWEEYMRVIKAGYAGTFSSSGHIYVNGPTTSGMTWYLASSNIYEVQTSSSVYSNGSYADPSWITSLSASKIPGMNLEQVLTNGNTTTKSVTIGGTLSFSGTGSMNIHNEAYAFKSYEFPSAGMVFTYARYGFEFRDGGANTIAKIGIQAGYPNYFIQPLGVGLTAPTAMLHIAAGTSTTPSLKLTSSTLVTTPQAGSIEYNGTHLYATIGVNRYQLDQQTTGLYNSSNFVNKESPSGTTDGTNATFVLTNIPVLGSDHIYVNGVLMEENSDYTISGKTITFLTGAIPEASDKIRVSYQK